MGDGLLGSCARGRRHAGIHRTCRLQQVLLHARTMEPIQAMPCKPDEQASERAL
jgi:hypothetical protein